MKIGINAIFLVAGEGGGIERYLRNIIKALKKLDHENEYIIFTNKDNTGTFDLGDNFTEYFTPVSARFRLMKILWEQFLLPFQVKAAGIDVLFSPGNISPLFVSCPSVVVIHDLIPFVRSDNFSKIELCALRFLLRLTAKMATRIITISRSSEREIMSQFQISSDRISVIYLACDQNFFYSQPSAEETGKLKKQYGIKGDFVLCTASTRPYKNIDRLLLAFSILKKRHAVKHRLVLVGASGRHHRFLLKMVADLGLNEDVVFTGFVPDKVLPALYSAASVFVYPSLYEGFGLPILEAMACGTPVVASNITSMPEVVGDAGLMFDPYDVEEMCKRIYRILSNEERRNKLIAKGKQRVREFSWEKTAMEVVNVLQAQYNSVK